MPDRNSRFWTGTNYKQNLLTVVVAGLAHASDVQSPAAQDADDNRYDTYTFIIISE